MHLEYPMGLNYGMKSHAVRESGTIITKNENQKVQRYRHKALHFELPPPWVWRSKTMQMAGHISVLDLST